MRFCFQAFLAFFVLYQVQSQTYESNGYKDVVVSIHPDVPSDQQQLVVDNLKVDFDFSFENLKLNLKI